MTRAIYQHDLHSWRPTLTRVWSALLGRALVCLLILFVATVTSSVTAQEETEDPSGTFNFQPSDEIPGAIGSSGEAIGGTGNGSSDNTSDAETSDAEVFPGGNVAGGDRPIKEMTEGVNSTDDNTDNNNTDTDTDTEPAGESGPVQRIDHEYNDQDDQKAIEAARDALSGFENFPFYDPSKDSLRKIQLPPEEKTKPKTKTGGGNTAAKKAPPPATTPANTGSGASILGQVLQVVGILVLVGLLILIAVLIARTFLKSEVTETSNVELEVGPSSEVDRVEQLPFQLKRPTGDFLSEARLAYEQGDYARAIAYLYSHQLVQLDRHQWIRLSKGKTNRQYVRELKSQPQLREILENSIALFEASFFGHHTITREQFTSVWQQVDTFQQQVTQQEHLVA